MAAKKKGKTSTGRARKRRDLVISADWKAWMAENLMRGVDEALIVRRVRRAGATAAQCRAAIDTMRRAPSFEAGRRVGVRLRQMELLTRLNTSVRASVGPEVERRRKPAGRAFLEQYLATSTPVVLTDAMRGWKALRRWSPRYLEREFGKIRVAVTTGRESDPDYDRNTQKRSVETTLGEFARRVASAGETNDFYLVANNHAMKRRGMRRLLDDIVVDPDYFNPKHTMSAVSFWFGPAGTVTPMHHDTTNILLHQVIGEKRILLVPPFEDRALQHAQSVYCAIDPEDPDCDLPSMEVVLKKGEALFIPVGWWHHVRALEPSINLALTNFRVANDYEWFRPGEVG